MAGNAGFGWMGDPVRPGLSEAGYRVTIHIAN